MQLRLNLNYRGRATRVKKKRQEFGIASGTPASL
jgi:hypothetical protein